jgi:hypothetical protein
MVFFLFQAIYDLCLLYGTTAPGITPERLTYLVSMYQAPLRDLQIHGFALLIILGVGIRMLPALFGFRAPRPVVVRAGLVMLVFGVLGEATMFILMRRYGGRMATGALRARRTRGQGDIGNAIAGPPQPGTQATRFIVRPGEQNLWRFLTGVSSQHPADTVFDGLEWSNRVRGCFRINRSFVPRTRILPPKGRLFDFPHPDRPYTGFHMHRDVVSDN